MEQAKKYYTRQDKKAIVYKSCRGRVGNSSERSSTSLLNRELTTLTAHIAGV